MALMVPPCCPPWSLANATLMPTALPPKAQDFGPAARCACDIHATPSESPRHRSQIAFRYLSTSGRKPLPPGLDVSGARHFSILTRHLRALDRARRCRRLQRTLNLMVAPVPRILIFLAIVLGIVRALHFYFWARLVRDTQLPFPTGPGHRRPGDPGGVPAPAIPRRPAAPPLSGRLLAWPAVIWMGLMFLLLVLLVGTDRPAAGVRGLEGGRRRAGPRAPADSGPDPGRPGSGPVWTGASPPPAGDCAKAGGHRGGRRAAPAARGASTARPSSSSPTCTSGRPSAAPSSRTSSVGAPTRCARRHRHHRRSGRRLGRAPAPRRRAAGRS